MKISYNAPAMRASNALNASDSKVSKSLQRLSSGLKVTASKDNPSGYAIGRRMNTQIVGIGTATQSSNNGISVIETADGALTEVHEMLQRMNELAVKGETGTLTTGDRMTLEAEVKQLKAEITRISTDTQFNGQTLLDGTFDLRGYTNNHKVKVDYYADEVTAKVYSISGLNIAYDKDGKIDKDKTVIELGPEFPEGVEISETTKTKITLTGPLDFKMTLEIPKDKDGNPVAGNLIESKQITIQTPPATTAPVGAAYTYSFNTTSNEWEASLDEKATKDSFAAIIGQGDIPADAQIDVIAGDGTAANPDKVLITSGNGLRMEIPFTNRPASSTTEPNPKTVIPNDISGQPQDATVDLLIDITGIGAMDTQTGANEGQQLAIRIPEISLNRMDMEDLKMTSIEECADANGTIRKAILYVSDARSRLGAYQNRLEHTINNLDVSNENMTSSYSRIMDVDMAEEMTNYTTEQVISQAAVSMLAQANERPSQVLQLLQ